MAGNGEAPGEGVGGTCSHSVPGGSGADVIRQLQEEVMRQRARIEALGSMVHREWK